jgi:hypothetical protein
VKPTINLNFDSKTLFLRLQLGFECAKLYGSKLQGLD